MKVDLYSAKIQFFLILLEAEVILNLRKKSLFFKKKKSDNAFIFKAFTSF